MRSKCHIETLPRPVTASFEDLENEPLDVFFAYGIVNPFGPTLSFVAALGESVRDATLPLLKVVLNPFSQSFEQVGLFTVGSHWSPVRDFRPLIELAFGGCPTLLLLNSSIPESERLPLAAQMLAEFDDDVADRLDYVEEHFGDPWNRVSAEMASAHDKGSATLSAKAAAEKLASMVLHQEHIWPELQAFLAAWRGSIEETNLPERMRSAALGAKRFTELLVQNILPSLWLPEAPKAN